MAKGSGFPSPLCCIVRRSTSLSKKILVVDDNQDTVQILTAVLKRGGYLVVAARDGVEAVQKVQEEKPSLVLSDIMMPKLDGFGVMEAMRADPGMNQIPVLIISAKVDPTSKARGLELGAKDYIIKPINPGEVLQKVRQHLQDAV
ncbi:MAG: response regulator [Candidatus Manganitrophaceae bacterium]|nr:MAG: response regulator [Candidatus Manganitrophaceae bacterium]